LPFFNPFNLNVAFAFAASSPRDRTRRMTLYHADIKHANHHVSGVRSKRRNDRQTVVG
jgi:hypothetical protein